MMIFQILVNEAPQNLPLATANGTGSMTPMVLLFIGIVAVFVLGYLGYLIKNRFAQPELMGLSREKIASTWAQIEQASEQGMMGAKLAVIEADKLFDGVLKSMYFPGETMSERLKVAQFKYPAVQNVWTAHKLRNQLVHDTSFEISPRQAKQAVKDFAAALRALHVL